MKSAWPIIKKTNIYVHKTDVNKFEMLHKGIKYHIKK